MDNQMMNGCIRMVTLDLLFAFATSGVLLCHDPALQEGISPVKPLG